MSSARVKLVTDMNIAMVSVLLSAEDERVSTTWSQDGVYNTRLTLPT